MPGLSARPAEPVYAIAALRYGACDGADSAQSAATTATRALAITLQTCHHHAYLALYLWMRQVAPPSWWLHVGKTATWEWLPGKAFRTLPATAFP